MNKPMVTTKYMQGVMQQFGQGKEIQMREKASVGEWKDTTNPSWNWEKYDYRKKPKENDLTALDPESKYDGFKTIMFVGDNNRIVTGRGMFSIMADVEDDEMLLVEFRSIEVVKKRHERGDILD